MVHGRLEAGTRGPWRQEHLVSIPESGNHDGIPNRGRQAENTVQGIHLRTLKGIETGGRPDGILGVPRTTTDGGGNDQRLTSVYYVLGTNLRCVHVLSYLMLAIAL